MALDYHSTLSLGLGRDPDEATSDSEKAARMVSHGLIDVLFEPDYGNEGRGLNDVGTSTTL